MPIFDNHLIIYSSENQLVAENIAATYLSVGKEAELLPRNSADFSQQLGAVKCDDDSAILLLISDNSLKSYGCMNGVLQAAQKWGDDDRLIAIITEGTQEGLDGNASSVKTKFERVEDIILYLNYWQDQYLDLRKLRRDASVSGELDDQIAVTKDIAGEIGEFLRFIRNYGFQQSNEFVSFIEESANSAASNNPIPDGAALLPPKKWGKKEKSPEETERDLVEMIQKSSEELLAELMIENRKKKEHKSKEQFADELTEELLKKIPGLSLLAQQNEADDQEEEEEQQEEVLANAKTAKKGFSKKEIEKLDNENDELMSILDEVLQEAGFESENEEDEFKFIGDDPDNPNEFNLDALMEDEVPIKKMEEAKPGQLSENEVLLNMIEEEEDGITFSTEAETQEILEEAIELFQENHIEEGIKCFEEAVDDFPGDTTLRYYFAYSLAKFVNDFEAAKSQLGVLLKQDNSHPDAWFLLAELAENQQDFEGAKICFERTIECDENFPNVHYRLGLLLIEHFENEEEMAANLLKIAIERDPENADAEYMLATIMNEMLGEPELSIPHFKRALTIHPKHPFANYDLALLYHQFGDKDRASKYYHEAIAINPELGTPQNDEAFDLAAANIELDSEKLDPLVSENDEVNQDESALLTEDEKQEPTQQTSNAIADTKAKQTKTVLITGGTAGIGKATAEVFAKNGYRVIITGRREERLSDISKSFSEKYDTAFHTLTFDVRDLDAVKSSIDNLPEDWKNIDILINNAGLSKGLEPIQEGNVEDWNSMIDTNVKGLLYITRAVSPQMVERKNGHIINVSSIAGTEVYPGGNVYCASKAAVSSLTRSMRLDLHQHNIRVSQVAPGHVEETEFARVRFDWDSTKAKKVYENFQPLKSSDIAETIYFIATRPAHVNIQDIYMYGTQQASATMINRSGR